MSNFSLAAFLLSCLLVGAGRLIVPGHALSWAGTYEAFAHIWVGAMLAVAWMRWTEPVGKVAAAMLVLLTAQETVMFLARAGR